MARVHSSGLARLAQRPVYRNLALGVGFAAVYAGLTILFIFSLVVFAK
jgi:hypothetical protein